MNRLLVICGPTASGKTSLALQLSELVDGEIVSADSRQVYIGMDIGPGKDLPKGSKLIIEDKNLSGYYEIGKTRLWGYDLVSPREEFSVAQYSKIIRKVIKDIYKRGKTPILVGGTGLYIKSVVDGIPTEGIPKNNDLRINLETKTTDELFEMLAQLDATRAGSLNSSDKKNPRRLIRAIEIATWKLSFGEENKNLENSKQAKFDTLFIGLSLAKEEMNKRIQERIEKRIQEGIVDEIKGLLDKGIKWTDQSMTSLGYRQWEPYFEGQEQDMAVIITKWMGEERNYAKRQVTWFKKDKRVNWFNIEKEGWYEGVEKLVKKWYKSRYAKEN
jgi:tRNA dimethylallyltransferase